MAGKCSDVLDDGSVELVQRWMPGGSQGNMSQQFVSGDRYLMAVRLADETWDIQGGNWPVVIAKLMFLGIATPSINQQRPLLYPPSR